MRDYPSIPSYAELGRGYYKGMTIYAWDKLDGSNMRAEWSSKKGFYKFGKRKHLASSDTPFLTEAPDLFRNKYEDDLDKIFRKNRWERAICFFEFFGPNSFAGNHEEKDRDKFDVVLFDVALNKKTIMAPKEFYKMFGRLNLPNLIHVGRVNHEFADQILNSAIEGVSYEGVVCKGFNKERGLIMFKIKSRAWVDEVRQYYRDDDRKLKELL